MVSTEVWSSAARHEGVSVVCVCPMATPFAPQMYNLIAPGRRTCVIISGANTSHHARRQPQCSRYPVPHPTTTPPPSPYQHPQPHPTSTAPQPPAPHQKVCLSTLPHTPTSRRRRVEVQLQHACRAEVADRTPSESQHCFHTIGSSVHAGRLAISSILQTIPAYIVCAPPRAAATGI